MITTQLPDGTPQIFNSGMAVKDLNPQIPTPLAIPINDVCLCDFDCLYTECVFALDDVNFWENDKNLFLFRGLTSSDVIDIKLFKEDIEIATIIDDTYGEYIPGFPPPATDEQQLYVAFTIDWFKVLTLNGAGTYQLKTDTVIAGVSQTFESQKFFLTAYTDEDADGTVRIEATQNGNIIRSQFDFTGLNLQRSFRIRGKLTNASPSIEIDNYLTQTYLKEQILDKIVNEWELETGLIPAIISNELIYNDLLANEILITDYNIKNEEIYRRISLYPLEIEKTPLPQNVNSKYLIKFTDKVDDIRKRNF